MHACSHPLLPMRFSPILSLHSWPFRLSFRDADRGRRNKAFSTSWPGYAVARGSEPAVPRALRREPHGEEKITRCFHFVPPVCFPPCAQRHTLARHAHRGSTMMCICMNHGRVTPDKPGGHNCTGTGPRIFFYYQSRGAVLPRVSLFHLPPAHVCATTTQPKQNVASRSSHDVGPAQFISAPAASKFSASRCDSCRAMPCQVGATASKDQISRKNKTTNFFGAD
jgi:hypothetical protein